MNLRLIKNGLFNENPVFVQLLALCPLLAVTTSAMNALYMGISTTAVIIGASVVISLVRRFISGDVRIASYVVIVAGFVTVLQLLLAAYAPPAINDSLGIFIPLIVCNCIVFARIESFASKNAVFASAIDGLGMGAGYTLGLVVVGIIRELLGSGTFFGIPILTEPSSHMLIMLMAPGAFFTLGSVIMVIKHRQLKQKKNAQQGR